MGRRCRTSPAATPYKPHRAFLFRFRKSAAAAYRDAFRNSPAVSILDANDIARSRVNFTLTPASVVTGQPRVDDFLRSSAVFDARQHPAITFRSIRVVPVDADSAVIDGILSARGKSREEKFKATLRRERGIDIAFHVVGKVLRSPYGMDVGTPIYSNVVTFDMILRGSHP